MGHKKTVETDILSGSVNRRRVLKSLAAGTMASSVGVAGVQAKDTKPRGRADKPPNRAQPVSTDEPPVNEYFDSPVWPCTHRNSYAQGSSPNDGPTAEESLEHLFTKRSGIPITLAFSSRYPDGKRVIWGSQVGSLNEIFKLDADTLEVIDSKFPPRDDTIGFAQERDPTEGPSPEGAYTVLDEDGTFFVAIQYEEGTVGINAYGDLQPNNRTSDIAHKRRYVIPESKLQQPDEENIIGLVLTYDGKLVFGTNLGTIGMISRDLSPESADYLPLHAQDSGGVDEPGRISNSFATDEDGGIYVVTSRRMYRIQQTDSGLTLDPSKGAWTASYETGGGQQAGRLGAGSGSTPSLMGTGEQDKFVAITDGQRQAHLTLFWRDEIPNDWEPIAPGKDRRIAAEVPITFGHDDAERSVSEQSLLVRGYGVVAVNDKHREAYNSLPGDTSKYIPMLDNVPGEAPRGIQKFHWNPETRELEESWANPDVSMPNGIPTMSAETELVYDIGRRDGNWTLEAVDWASGEHAFSHSVGKLPTYNSYYAGTEVGPGGRIYTGTYNGVLQFRPIERDG